MREINATLLNKRRTSIFIAHRLVLSHPFRKRLRSLRRLRTVVGAGEWTEALVHHFTKRLQISLSS